MKRSIFFGALICALLAVFAIWKVKATVDGASALCGGSQFGTSLYWSSSQSASNGMTPIEYNAWLLNFGNGDWVNDMKRSERLGTNSVCAIRAFFILKYLPDYTIFSSSSLTLHCKNKTSTLEAFASMRDILQKKQRVVSSLFNLSEKSVYVSGEFSLSVRCILKPG